MFFFTFFLLREFLEVLFLQYEIRAKVFLPYNGIGSKLLWFSLEKDASLKEQIGTIGNIQRLMNVMVSYQDADIPVFQMPYDMLDVLHRNSQQTARRA